MRKISSRREPVAEADGLQLKRWCIVGCLFLCPSQLLGPPLTASSARGCGKTGASRLQVQCRCQTVSPNVSRSDGYMQRNNLLMEHEYDTSAGNNHLGQQRQETGKIHGVLFQETAKSETTKMCATLNFRCLRGRCQDDK